MRIRCCDTVSAARSLALAGAADVGALIFPVVGTMAGDGALSCFVEVPFAAVPCSAAPVSRTILHTGGYAELLLCLREVLSGSTCLGFLLAGQPLVLSGDHFQGPDADHAIALVKGLMPADGTASAGPSRCVRCNANFPAARSRAVGSTALCVRCQGAIEEDRHARRYG
jgi:hypothetical protein